MWALDVISSSLLWSNLSTTRQHLCAQFFCSRYRSFWSPDTSVPDRGRESHAWRCSTCAQETSCCRNKLVLQTCISRSWTRLVWLACTQPFQPPYGTFWSCSRVCFRSTWCCCRLRGWASDPRAQFCPTSGKLFGSWDGVSSPGRWSPFSLWCWRWPPYENRTPFKNVYFH